MYNSIGLFKEVQKVNEWKDFKGNKWKEEINVKQFILDNYTEYKVMKVF